MTEMYPKCEKNVKHTKNTDLLLHLVGLFSEALSDKGLCGLKKACASSDPVEVADGASAFYRELLSGGHNDAAQYLTEKLLGSATTFGKQAAAGNAERLFDRANTELEILKRFIETDCRELKEKLPEHARKYFPEWKSGVFDVSAKQLGDEYEKNGYGAVRASHSMVLDENTAEFTPLKNTDNVRLSDLKEYAEEKTAAVNNTLAFIEGRPACNVLLYGDRGTGKSSTVHALINEFAPRGLRLLQISKSAIPMFPAIKEKLALFPKLRFILFIDDLAFEENDGAFAELKAALEGSMATAENALIYVTTNRRHLVKESRSSRSGDDVHVSDTAEEQLSLFDRFGLVITYLAPDKNEYVSILHQILADRGINVAPQAAALAAERYAIKKGGRSPRAAKQLADMIQSGTIPVE